MSADFPPLFDAVWFRFAVGFLSGAILGSFATMLAYRLPRKMSIVRPRSHCPSCNAVLSVCDLVPVFSWLAMRGRCRHCHAKIGMRYLIIEIATSLACAAACVTIGFSPWLGVGYAAIVAVIVAIYIKLSKKEPV
jgi:prepilin signal peptidase PulO-like enzyme (type II secretory pathway)